MRAREARLLMERYLAEGGAGGHLMHLYDNPDLTFGELKDVLSSAAEGRLEKVTEKLDGMNLVFTWDGALKVARSGGDIKGGGLDAMTLAQKFHGRENVADAFNGAFKVLNEAMAALPEKARKQVFEGGRVWYSIEVIYSKNPNVINYDSDWVVFHSSPVFRVNEDGTVDKQADAVGVEVLERYVDRMQKAVTQRSWQVRGPAMLRLKKISDGSVVTRAINAIDQAQNAGGVGDGDTIGDFLKNIVAEHVADLDLRPDAAAAVVSRIVGFPGAPKLTDIKKMVPADQYPSVNEFVKASPALLKKAIEPLEHAIHNFAIEVLRGLHSVLVGNHDKEVQRLRSEVSNAVKAIQASGDVAGMDVLHKQMQKLGNVENVATAMEGVVFIYKGNAYKFTGAFAPANQILGLFKYGRKGSKLGVQESYLRHVVDRLVEKAQAPARPVKAVPHGWQNWPASVSRVPYVPKQKGVGPGEERLAKLLGGEVMGGGESYDITDAQANKWEVKEPSGGLRGEIRPGTEGLAAVQVAFGRIKNVVKRIENVFGSRGMSRTAEAAAAVMGPEVTEKIREFVASEAPMIMKGEASKGRMEALGEILHLINAALRVEADGTEVAGIGKKHVEMGDDQHHVEADVDLPTYVKLGKVMDMGPKELNVSSADVLRSSFNSVAFRDPDKFLETVWKQAAKASVVFGHTSGVILVSPHAYRVVPKPELDDVLVFNRITKGFPHFKASG